MFEDIKRFFQHSAVYGVGNIINRGAAFILLPLYTHYLSPSEYGTLSLFYLTSSVARVLLSMGISHATLRFYFEYKRERERRSLISTCLLASLAISAVGVLLSFPFLGALSQRMFHTDVYVPLFKIVLLTLVMEMSIEIARSFIRAKGRPVLFMSAAFIQLFAQVGFNVYAVVVLKKGVEGILLGNMASVALVGIVLIGITFRYAGLHFDPSKLKSVLRYSAPLIPSPILAMLVISLDRFLLLRFSTLAVVGLYSLGRNFGMLLNVVIIEPFTLSFGPYRFSVMHQPNARQIYARIFTYFVAALSFACLGLSVCATEAIQIMSSPEYLEASRVVPIICLGMLFSGATYIMQSGIYVTKKTKHIFHVSLIGLVSKSILLFCLIPRFNMYGAAVAMLVSASIVTAATYFFAQKVYPMAYEWGRVASAVGVALGIYLLSLGIRFDSLALNIVLKFLLVLSFPLVLAAAGFYRPEEFRVIARWVKRERSLPTMVPQS